MGNRQGAADSIVESMNLSALELPESNSKNFLLTVMGPGGGGWRLGAEAGASDGVMETPASGAFFLGQRRSVDE